MGLSWKFQNITLEKLNAQSINTMAEVLGITFTAIGDDYLCATMPVNHNTQQPYGLLHGGASAALAETIGSVASWLCIDQEKEICTGIEINCNHVRGKKSGVVTARVEALHVGAKTHVWDIKIRDEKEKLICVSRLTVAILKKPNDQKEDN
ncbi:MAG: hotdog fold thioesterase [Bacteroidetes bacterium]|nr:hotdog fold thioesterase [Bacteroidota bacterium]